MDVKAVFLLVVRIRYVAVIMIDIRIMNDESKEIILWKIRSIWQLIQRKNRREKDSIVQYRLLQMICVEL